VSSHERRAPAPTAEPPEKGIDHGGELDLPGGPDAALLLHGLTGSTFELHPLAARLQAAGLRVLAPVMAGHGGAPAALRGVPWTEWVTKAGRDLARLGGARRTFVIGASMGGLVACALAHDLPAQVDGLVLLAPALELTSPGRLAALLGRAGPLRRWIVPKGGFDVADAHMRRCNRGLTAVPVGAVAELAKLSRRVERLLPAIRAPALVLVGAHDHTVTLRGVRRLAAALGSGPAPVQVLPTSAHLLAIDVERDRCAEEVVRFVQALAPGKMAGAAAVSPSRTGPAGADAAPRVSDPPGRK
jgi:carboxylesterase